MKTKRTSRPPYHLKPPRVNSKSGGTTENHEGKSKTEATGWSPLNAIRRDVRRTKSKEIYAKKKNGT